MSFEIKSGHAACIKFVGIGDTGAGVMRRIMQADNKDIDLIAVHTEEQAFSASGASVTIQISAPPRMDKPCALSRKCTIEDNSRDAVAKALAGAEMVIIVADMGSCIGAASVVAGIARELGILTIGIVTKPSETESHAHMLQAETGVAALLAQTDSLVVIPNARLAYAIHQKNTPVDAFEMAHDALYQVVQSILDFARPVGPVCLDFSDIASILRNVGMVYVGMGRDAGELGGEAAAKMAISAPLTETSICGARRLLINITCAERFGVKAVERVCNVVQQAADPDASFVLAVSYDKTQKDEISVTVIAAAGGSDHTVYP